MSKLDRKLRAQRLAMETIPMQGDGFTYRQRIADFISGFEAAYADIISEVIIDKALKQFKKQTKSKPVA